MAGSVGHASYQAGRRWPAGRSSRLVRTAQAAPWPSAPSRGRQRVLRQMCASVATICCDRAGGLDAPAARTRDRKSTQKGRCDTSRDMRQAALTVPRRQTTSLHGVPGSPRSDPRAASNCGRERAIPHWDDTRGTSARVCYKRRRSRVRRPRRPRPALAGALAASPGGSALRRRCLGCKHGSVSRARSRTRTGSWA